MDDTGKIFERLIHLSRKKGMQVKFVPFKTFYGRVKGDRIGIANDLHIDEINYNLAHELAHTYLHYDKGNIVENDGSYEEQADRAAHMIIDALSVF